MFTHLISLKKAPWFIYAQGEDDALKICKRHKDLVVGVVSAPEGLIMQEVKTEVRLVTPDIKLIEEIVESENRHLAEEILGEMNEEDKKLVVLPQKQIEEVTKEDSIKTSETSEASES